MNRIILLFLAFHCILPNTGEATDKTCSLSIKPKSDYSCDLTLLFRTIPSESERLILTSLNVGMDPQLVRGKSRSLFGWFLSDVHDDKKNQLWIGGVLPPNAEELKLEISLPGILQKSTAITDEDKESILFISFEDNGLPKYFANRAQEDKIIYVPIQSIIVTPDELVSVEKCDPPWIRSGINNLEWTSKDSSRIFLTAHFVHRQKAALLMIIFWIVPGFVTGWLFLEWLKDKFKLVTQEVIHLVLLILFLFFVTWGFLWDWDYYLLSIAFGIAGALAGNLLQTVIKKRTT